MAILGNPDAQVEVRILKPPFDSAQPVYFDEYAPLDKRDSSKTDITRYIVPGKTSFAFEFTWKKGFNYGAYDHGYEIMIRDKVSKTQLYHENFDISHHNSEAPLREDQKRVIEYCPFAIVDGQPRRDVNFTFHSLRPDENLCSESDVFGYKVDDLGGFEIIFTRYNEGTTRLRTDDELHNETQPVEAAIAAAKNTLTLANSLDQYSFNKDGITHGMSLTGGHEVNSFAPPKTIIRFPDKKLSHRFRFFCRTVEYLDSNGFARTPIPQERYLWSCLDDSERKSSFRKLQKYDRQHTMRQIVQKGKENADLKTSKNLVEPGDVNRRWCLWGKLLKCEREGLFKQLQTRRERFEWVEVPQEGSNPSNPPKSADSSKKWSRTAKSLVRDATKEKHEAEDEKDEDAVLNSAVSVKKEVENMPKAVSNVQRSKTPEAMVIVLEDSPPLGTKRSVLAAGLLKQKAIEEEPVDIAILSSEATAGRIEPEEQSASKRIKLQTDVPVGGGLEDAVLARLEEEDELLQLELANAQRISELLRQSAEKKSRIAALKSAQRATLSGSRPH